MRLAIRLAMGGRGRVEPNPMVGCVIVKDGRIIGVIRPVYLYGGKVLRPAQVAVAKKT